MFHPGFQCFGKKRDGISSIDISSRWNGILILTGGVIGIGFWPNFGRPVYKFPTKKVHIPCKKSHNQVKPVSVYVSVHFSFRSLLHHFSDILHVNDTTHQV